MLLSSVLYEHGPRRHTSFLYGKCASALQITALTSERETLDGYNASRIPRSGTVIEDSTLPCIPNVFVENPEMVVLEAFGYQVVD